MEDIISGFDPRAKSELLEHLPWLAHAQLRLRYLIIIHLYEGRSPRWIADALKVDRSTVYRTVQRFREEGESGLFDHREQNGQLKVTEEYLEALAETVAGDPPAFGWKRPTWTRELLIETLARETGVRIGLSTMSTALRRIRARRGRPKPTVRCPWPEAEKQRRLDEIATLVETAPPDEVVVDEDEVDLHLNPKIGADWMLRGQQKEVPTPGQNEKRYLAGAQDARTKELICVEGERKNSDLFLRLLWELVTRYPTAKKIHMILDNYGIPTSRLVQSSLQSPQGQRIDIQFLPPYCPDHNKIERTWQDLHANVTRNHQCSGMQELMKNVRHYIRECNRRRTAVA
jgi:transposase